MSAALIDRLAVELTPARPRDVTGRLAAALALGWLASLALVLALFGPRPDLGVAVGGAMFWVKAAYALALAAGAGLSAAALARPGGRARVAGVLVLPALALATLAMWQLAGMTPMERMPAMMGHTAAKCPWLILLSAAPVYAALIMAFRAFAPTRLRYAGAAAGLAAGAAGALAYGDPLPRGRRALRAGLVHARHPAGRGGRYPYRPETVTLVTPEGRMAKAIAYRHPLSRRINHWVNVVTVITLLMTGLNIFDAHPALYWGRAGNEYDRPVLMISGANGHGVTTIAGRAIPTTGLLGWSGGHATGFPAWATIPSFRDLAAARNWHLLFAWILIVNGPGVLDHQPAQPARAVRPAAVGARDRTQEPVARHRDTREVQVSQGPRLEPLSSAAEDRLPVAHRRVLADDDRYRPVAMSPGADAVAPWIVDLLGGRQSARTLHFVFMALTLGFIVVHVVLVLLAGFLNQMRAMITGWWAYDPAIDTGMPEAKTTLARDAT